MVTLEIQKSPLTSGSAKFQVVELKGQLDASGVPVLEKTVSEMIEAGENGIIFLCSELEYCSSAGLGLFLAFHRRMTAAGGQICLAAVRDEIVHIMKVLGFDKIISTYESADEAASALTDR